MRFGGRLSCVLLLLCVTFGFSSGQATNVSPTEVPSLGVSFVVNTAAPYCVILPSIRRSETDLFELARRFNRLGMNAVVLPAESLYTQPVAHPDSLLSDLRARLDLLRAKGDQPFIVVGEGRSASIALIAATRDFRIKAVIAASPGEYFPTHNYVENALKKLRIPTLSLYTEAETETVMPLFRELPRALLIKAPVLRSSGYADMVLKGKESGPSWLAISIFCHEQFGL